MSDFRAELLNGGLARHGKRRLFMFLDLVGEWLQPNRTRLWPNGIQAVISAVADPEFTNLPPF